MENNVSDDREYSVHIPEAPLNEKREEDETENSHSLSSLAPLPRRPLKRGELDLRRRALENGLNIVREKMMTGMHQALQGQQQQQQQDEDEQPSTLGESMTNREAARMLLTTRAEDATERSIYEKRRQEAMKKVAKQKSDMIVTVLMGAAALGITLYLGYRGYGYFYPALPSEAVSVMDLTVE